MENGMINVNGAFFGIYQTGNEKKDALTRTGYSIGIFYKVSAYEYREFRTKISFYVEDNSTEFITDDKLKLNRECTARLISLTPLSTMINKDVITREELMNFLTGIMESTQKRIEIESAIISTLTGQSSNHLTNDISKRKRR